ncbi:MAG: S8 family serine peptidase [Coleofasciculus sp.]
MFRFARSLLQNLHNWLHSFSSQPSQFQTFILEQILTPSGLLDGGDFDETPDLDATIELDPDIDAISPEILDLGDEDMDFIPFIPTDTLEQFESGVFTVGETGEIEIDYLYDGGGYQGELAIFSLEGMEEYDLGSPEFIREAARRALGNDPDAMGQVVISDATEGAKLEGRYLKEGNFNRGEYQGTTKVTLKGGERFAFMLVPNGTVQQVYDGLDGGSGELAKSLRPLFSLSTANPEDGLSLGQIADVTGDGHTFVMEDMRVDGWTDEDYNDIIFQIKGATGEAVALDEVIDSDLDWRETQLGEALYAAITPDVPELPIDPVTGAEYIPGQLLLKFDADLSDAEVQTLAESYGTTEFERLIPEDPDADFALEQWRLLNFDPDRDVVAIRDAIAQETGVVASELNGVRSLHWRPDDTHFGDLWGLNNTNDADIDAPEAWDIQRGSKDVVVAVIDTGVDYTHPDLADNMWRNLAELNGTPDVDDDGNGYIDDIYGYDFGNMDGDPKPDYLSLSPVLPDFHYGHGTHVAGTIGAVGNNDLGVTGVSPNVSLMALNVRNSNTGRLSLNAIASAIRYATDNGADVINASFGGEHPSILEFDAISYANDSDVLFVTSAGNDSSNNDIFARYPNNYNLPNIISVAATDWNDNLVGFSNYGSTTVDLGAPGYNILSTLPGNLYGSASGTSMAAPHVAGAAALVIIGNPTWTATEVKAALLNNSNQKDSLVGKTVSGGRLDLGLTPSKVGSEFQVNPHTYPGGDRLLSIPSIAALKDGNFVITWALGKGVYGQRYDQNNNPVGSEFLVNTNTDNLQDTSSPSIAALQDGGFVITWASRGQDGSGQRIYGQRYDQNNNPVGSEFLVNTDIENLQDGPSIAALKDSGFVIIWASGKGVYGQRYDQNNNSVGNEFPVNTNTANKIQGFTEFSLDKPSQTSSIAALQDGGFVITWASRGQDGSGQRIYGQRYDQNNNFLGDKFEVDITTANRQYAPSIAVLKDGSFVIIWASWGQGIYGQRYDQNNNPVGGKFEINTTTENSQQRQYVPSIVGLEDGGFVVTWAFLYQDEYDENIFYIYGQRYNRNGNPLGLEFRVNPYRNGLQSYPSIAGLENGNFVITWHLGHRFSRGSGAVFAQYFHSQRQIV